MAVSIKKIGNDTEVDRILNETFTSAVRSTGFVEVGEEKFVLPALYIDWEEKIRNFEVRDEDVFILGHLKTGTTWLQEMVWLIANDLDYEKAEIDVVVRVPLFEYPAYFDCNVVNSHLWFDAHPWDFINQHESPRVFKSHLHWSLLPEQLKNGTKKPRIISILRNPHDTFISYYHHCRLMEGFKGTFEDMTKLFLAGRSIFGPYFKSILSIWEQKHRSNVLFLKFTEMKSDLPGVIRKVAKFLEKPITEEQVEKLAKYLSFESMRKNPALNMRGVVNMYAKKYGLNIADNEFIRSGKVGGYKAEMTPEMIEKFNQWQKENLAGTDLSFE